MRLITYFFAAALLWAIATSGPATPNASSEAPPRAGADGPSAVPRAADATYRR
ncbi:MAG TPA: hypothetical protein VF904_16390 [Anaeromyxobacteraceae bacterium]